MKISTIINYIASIVMWLSGLLTLISNILRWDCWDDFFFITILYLSPIVLLTNMFAFVFTLANTAYSDIKQSRKYLCVNAISAVISILVFIGTFWGLSGWIGNW